jgi:hypothetical protein
MPASWVDFMRFAPVVKGVVGRDAIRGTIRQSHGRGQHGPSNLNETGPLRMAVVGNSSQWGSQGGPAGQAGGFRRGRAQVRRAARLRVALSPPPVNGGRGWLPSRPAHPREQIAYGAQTLAPRVAA